MRRAVGNPLLVLELLLERHEPLTKRLSREKPLRLPAAIGTGDDGHILRGLVVVARFHAERRLTAFIKPHHEGLLTSSATREGWLRPAPLLRSTPFKF